MENMGNELRTVKHVVFGPKSTDLSVSTSNDSLKIDLTMTYSGGTDGIGYHWIELRIRIPGVKRPLQFLLDEYEDHDDMFSSKLRPNDLKEFKSFWNSPGLSSAVEDALENCATDDTCEDASSNPADEKLLRDQFFDFLNHVVCALKSTHPYDSDDD